MGDNLKSSAKETKNRSLEPNVDESEFDLTSTDVKQPKNQQIVPPISLEETSPQAIAPNYPPLDTPRTPQITPRTPPGKKNPNKEKIKRTLEEMRELLACFNFEDIESMKNIFQMHNGVLTEAQFVKKMPKAFKLNISSEEEIVRKLSLLFGEIDVDGNGKISWDTFTTFIVKSGVDRRDSLAFLKKYSEVRIKQDVPFFGLTKLKYLPQIERLVVCDKEKVVKLYKPEKRNLQTEYILTKELKGHTGTILNCEYMDERKYLVTSSVDNTLGVWDVDMNFRCRHQIQTSCPQMGLAWSNQYNLFLSIDTDGIVKLWNVEKWKEKSSLRGHTDIGTSLVLIPNTPLLASGSVDSKILIWDINSCTQYRALEGHTKGVFSLAYSHDHRFLLSAGSDRDGLIWNPMVKNRPIFRLKGHHSSLVGIETIEGTNQLITADMTGVFKIWDVRTFECIQTFGGAHDANFEMTSFCSVSSQNQIVCGGSKMEVFEYDKPGTPWLSMEIPITKAIHVPSDVIVTIGGDMVRLWDPMTGSQLKSYGNLCSRPDATITAANVDTGGKKLILGDSTGIVQILNLHTGVVLKKYEAHKAYVSEVLYCKSIRSIISAGWDKQLNIQDEQETAIADSNGRSASQEHENTSCAFSELLGLIACGTIKGMIGVWEHEKLGFEAELGAEISVKDEITTLVFMVPFPVLCSADNKGMIRLWAVKSAMYKYQLLLEFEHTCPKGVSSIQSLAWGSESILYIGDDHGYITAWDFSSVLKKPTEESVAFEQKTKKQSGSGIVPINFKSIEMKDVRILHQWKAHYSTVTSIQAISDPPSLLTASTDRRARLWGIHGEYKGSLRQQPGGSWAFPLDEQMLLKQEMEQSLKIKELMDGNLKKKINFQNVTTATDESNLAPTRTDSDTSQGATKKHPGIKAKLPQVKHKKSKFPPNLFYESTRARMRTGDPNLNKFNPNQPGFFPVLMQGLPLPQNYLTAVNLQYALLPTKPEEFHIGTPDYSLPDELRFDDGSTFLDLVQKNASHLTKKQVSAAIRLSDALDAVEEEADPHQTYKMLAQTLKSESISRSSTRSANSQNLY